MSGGIYLGVMTATVLSGWGTFAAWRNGHRAAVWGVMALVAAIVVLLVYASSVATGHYLAGLGELLAALALALGPGVGIVLGLVTANWKQVGLALFFLYALGFAAVMVGIN